ncbi:helix-turn-helix domain-containing protein [Trichocoleus sp. FACHB-262]|uniref:AlbA family DNA-binding domain-containing protein n=1 Tax=Trichocoleus sp. FACHB-262 TaxID=2692869 RepID=UPI001684EA07|nr:ATP-binding protein [Trichocoleus sp. FACHB-262]MBD2120808.1 ATP-binding protein [Trichocoleus sp. FACHB-262]
MGLITSSGLPGHSNLRARICNALDRCQEFRDIDFKESGSWGELRWKIIRTVISMGNLRGGGIIILGVSQRNDTWNLDGISSEHLASFDVDDFTDQVNAYISPYVDITLVTVDYSTEQRFLAIAVDEFLDTPLVCKKNGPSPKDLVEGAIYVRSYGKPETTRIMRAEQLHDLLELAAEKRARRLITLSHRIGLVPGTSAKEQFDQELSGLVQTLPVPVARQPHWQIVVRPENYERELVPSLTNCSQLVERARVKLSGWSYPCLTFNSSLSARGSNWISSWVDLNLGRAEYWRIYQSGQFVHYLTFWSQSSEDLQEINQSVRRQSSYGMQESIPGYVAIPDMIFNMTGMYEFAARLCESGIYRGAVTFQVKLVGIRGFVLAQPRSWLGFSGFHQVTESSLEHLMSVSSIDLIANPREYAVNSVIWFVERFGWNHPPKTAFAQTQQQLFE